MAFLRQVWIPDKWTVLISHLSFSPECLVGLSPRELVWAMDEDRKIFFFFFLHLFLFDEDLIQGSCSQTLPDVRITWPAGHTMEFWAAPQSF